MITIKQQAELTFHHVDVKDAIMMANLMNCLSEAIAEKYAKIIMNELPDDKKNMYNKIYCNGVYIEPSEVEDIFNILSTIGFVATKEYYPEDILARHLKKD